jgi:uncharacterized membrane protein YczE
MSVRRPIMLLAGLALYGLSLTLLVRAGLGLAPWDVFHQGVSEVTGLSLGTVIVGTSFVVLLLWIPLRERPGIGTIANAILVGVGVDVFSALLPDVGDTATRWVLLAAGIVLNGVATGLYIGAGMGPGPRDGLMTGISRRGHPIRVVRTSLEVAVLAAGVLLGGSFGVGTFAYALCIGPLVHVFLPRFTLLASGEGAPESTPAPAPA